jgi:hypothetical protein
MAHPNNVQLLCLLVAFFAMVSVWLVLSWLRIVRPASSCLNNSYDLQMVPNAVLEAILRGRTFETRGPSPLFSLGRNQGRFLAYYYQATLVTLMSVVKARLPFIAHACTIVLAYSAKTFLP